MKIKLFYIFAFAIAGGVFSQADTLKYKSLIFADYLSPNKDGHNDFWIIKNIDSVPQNRLTIFNRWGEIVYRKENYYNEFEGIGNVSGVFGGNLLAEGVYFFEFNIPDGSKVTGKLTLDR